MTIRKIAAAASLALAAEAFMIPSTISLPGVELDSDGAFTALRMPDGLPDALQNLNLGVSKPHEESGVTNVLLDCKGCTFVPEHSGAEDVEAYVGNDLVCGHISSEG